MSEELPHTDGGPSPGRWPPQHARPSRRTELEFELDAPPPDPPDEPDESDPAGRLDAPEAAADESWEDEPPRLGLTGWLVATLVLLAALGATGYYGARLLLERAPIAQLAAVFPEVSLLPSTRPETREPGAEVRIYYVVPGGGLTAEVRRLPHAAHGIERARLIARELVTPPRAALLEPALPAGTGVRGLYVQNGIVLIDLSSEFASPARPSPSGERLAVYAVVDSFLLNDDSLRGVRLLVDGHPVATAWGWLDLSRPLGADLSLLQ